jgi:hypothetical protein
MALKKATSQEVKGRPLMGTKAIRNPIRTEMKESGYLMMGRIWRRKNKTPITIPAANWMNCLRVMSPTSRNS